MAFQGEYFVDRYGAKQAQRTPPIRRMLELGVPVGAGTDATRVSSYNPWVSLYWLITGKTVGGTAALPGGQPPRPHGGAASLHRSGAVGSPARRARKGALVPGQLADLAVLSADYFSIPEEEIKRLESVLTIVGGRIVFGAGEFGPLAPAAAAGQSRLVAGGAVTAATTAAKRQQVCIERGAPATPTDRSGLPKESRFWGIGCDCFAF